MCPSTPALCWGCENPSKYKCPRCEVRSCSLACVQRHKLEADCDGVRDRLKYLPINSFSDMDVVSDFRLLEEVTQQVDKCKRDKLKRSTRQGTEMTVAPRLPKRLQRLQSQARGRKCSLKILPPHFSRRKENTSCYDFQDRVIKWHVLLKFPNINKKMTLPSVSERTKLLNLLSEFVEWRSLDDPSDPFQMYRSVSYGGLSLYLKAETAPGQLTNRRYYPLDLRRSLKTNLQDKVIVEHPIIYVVFKTDEHLFRDEADDIHIPIKENKETAPDSENLGNAVGLGEVMSKTEDMQSDPEAYKQYFDFYLKYYTTKYAKHGVSPEDSLPSTPKSDPPKVNTNTFPKRGTPTPSIHRNAPPGQHPPLPSFPKNVPPPQRLPLPSFPRTVPPPQYSQPPSMPGMFPPPQKKNFSRESNFPRAPVDLGQTNRRNQEQAQNIKKQLKAGNPLGGLVDYDDSDSD